MDVSGSSSSSDIYHPHLSYFHQAGSSSQHAGSAYIGSSSREDTSKRVHFTACAAFNRKEDAPFIEHSFFDRMQNLFDNQLPLLDVTLCSYIRNPSLAKEKLKKECEEKTDIFIELLSEERDEEANIEDLRIKALEASLKSISRFKKWCDEHTLREAADSAFDFVNSISYARPWNTEYTLSLIHNLSALFAHNFPLYAKNFECLLVELAFESAYLNFIDLMKLSSSSFPDKKELLQEKRQEAFTEVQKQFTLLQAQDLHLADASLAIFLSRLISSRIWNQKSVKTLKKVCDKLNVNPHEQAVEFERKQFNSQEAFSAFKALFPKAYIKNPSTSLSAKVAKRNTFSENHLQLLTNQFLSLSSPKRDLEEDIREQRLLALAQALEAIKDQTKRDISERHDLAAAFFSEFIKTRVWDETSLEFLKRVHDQVEDLVLVLKFEVNPRNFINDEIYQRFMQFASPCQLVTTGEKHRDVNLSTEDLDIDAENIEKLSSSTQTHEDEVVEVGQMANVQARTLQAAAPVVFSSAAIPVGFAIPLVLQTPPRPLTLQADAQTEMGAEIPTMTPRKADVSTADAQTDELALTAEGIQTDPVEETKRADISEHEIQTDAEEPKKVDVSTHDIQTDPVIITIPKPEGKIEGVFPLLNYPNIWKHNLEEAFLNRAFWPHIRALAYVGHRLLTAASLITNTASLFLSSIALFFALPFKPNKDEKTPLIYDYPYQWTLNSLQELKTTISHDLTVELRALLNRRKEKPAPSDAS